MSEAPEDCDYGDLQLNVTYRPTKQAELLSESRFFRYEPGGALTPIDGADKC